MTNSNKRKRGRLNDSSDAPRVEPEGRRRRGRLNDSTDAPCVEPEGRRRRGGQPGNLNAFKHGLYIEGRSVRNTTPIERAELFDLNDIITLGKKFAIANYEAGLKSKNLDEFNTSARSLGIHAVGLHRLMTLHNQFQNSSLPTDFIVTKKTTVLNLVDHYKNKISSIIDISALENDLDSQTPLPQA